MVKTREKFGISKLNKAFFGQRREGLQGASGVGEGQQRASQK